MTKAKQTSPPTSAVDAGFTLVELLVVAGIVALAATIAVPLFRSAHRGHELKAGAIALAAEMKAARAAAVRTNIEQTVALDTQDGTYSASAIGMASGSPRPVRLPPGVTMELTTIRSEQSGLASGRVRFYPDGSATGGRIVLKSGARSAAVTVDWLTGGTRVDWQY